MKDEKLLFRIIRAAFNQRRKTLVNALSSAMGEITKEQIEKMRELHPDCLIDDTARDPDQGGWRVISYMPEVKHPRYALLREQFGYTAEDYNFVWNDKVYWDYYRGRR